MDNVGHRTSFPDITRL